jgi:orotate phosphoribosyltransferase
LPQPGEGAEIVAHRGCLSPGGAEIVAVAATANRSTEAKEMLEARGVAYATAYSLQEVALA